MSDLDHLIAQEARFHRAIVLSMRLLVMCHGDPERQLQLTYHIRMLQNQLALAEQDTDAWYDTH